MTWTFKEYILHLACGLGLFLVPAVHERVCADEALKSSAADACEATEAPTDYSSRTRKSKKPLALTALVPDVVAPRWPGHVPLAAERREQPLPVAAWQPLEPNAHGAATNPSVQTAWVHVFHPLAPAFAAVAEPVCSRQCGEIPSGALFVHEILRTGPPRA